MKRQNLRTVSLVVVTFTYLLIGAAIFGYLEAEHEVRQREALELIENIVRRKYNISDEDFMVLTTTVIKSVPHKAGIQWKFSGAFYFATTVVTTIGYGHSTPETMAGRSFCMVYALIGIPLGLVMFQSIGERLNTFVGAALRCAKRCLKTKNPEVTQTNLVMVVSVLSTILMTSMAAVFATYEKWAYFDALYYCFITLTTIGFGDYVALQKDSALQSKPEYVALSLIFILFGLSVVSSAVNLLVLKFLTLNTEDERRDEQLRYTASLNPIQLDGDIITLAQRGNLAGHPSQSPELLQLTRNPAQAPHNPSAEHNHTSNYAGRGHFGPSDHHKLDEPLLEPHETHFQAHGHELAPRHHTHHMHHHHSHHQHRQHLFDSSSGCVHRPLRTQSASSSPGSTLAGEPVNPSWSGSTTTTASGSSSSSNSSSSASSTSPSMTTTTASTRGSLARPRQGSAPKPSASHDNLPATRNFLHHNKPPSSRPQSHQHHHHHHSHHHNSNTQTQRGHSNHERVLSPHQTFTGSGGAARAGAATGNHGHHIHLRSNHNKQPYSNHNHRQCNLQHTCDNTDYYPTNYHLADDRCSSSSSSRLISRFRQSRSHGHLCQPSSATDPVQAGQTSSRLAHLKEPREITSPTRPTKASAETSSLSGSAMAGPRVCASHLCAGSQPEAHQVASTKAASPGDETLSSQTDIT